MLTENGEFLSSCLGKDSLFLHTNPKGRCLSGHEGERVQDMERNRSNQHEYG